MRYVPAQDARRCRTPARQVFRTRLRPVPQDLRPGQEVGPDITLNGRNSFEQLLSNVFDPSLVIGAAYQARTVVTADGRVLTGPGGRRQRAARGAQAARRQAGRRSPAATSTQMKTSQLSLMPEDLEKQLKPQELADLFAFITLDKPPERSQRARSCRARSRRTARNDRPRRSLANWSARWPRICGSQSGPAAAGDRRRTRRPRRCAAHPRRQSPASRASCAASLTCPATSKRGWCWPFRTTRKEPGTLTVKASGKRLHQALIGRGPRRRWQTLSLDLSALAGRKQDRAGSIESAKAKSKPIGPKSKSFRIERLKEVVADRQFRQQEMPLLACPKCQSRMSATQPPVAPADRDSRACRLLDRRHTSTLHP